MSSFDNLGIKPTVLQAISEIGYENPTPIQEKVIPQLINEEEDVIALAQTGTGKTAAFGLPLLTRVDTSKKHTQGLVLSPTRELAVQIADELKNFAKYDKQIRVTTVYGGANITTQIKDLRKGTTIVVATPGRLNDLIKRKEVKLEHVEYVILDEADEMLNMGFKEEIDFALEKTPDSKKVWLFSATMAREVRAIANNYMKAPVEVNAGKVNTLNANIKHQSLFVDRSLKYEALKRVIGANPGLFGVIFCRTKAETNELSEKLFKDGFNVGALNGDLSQKQRDAVMASFKAHRIDLLIATDVAARGIDVSDVTHVLHYNIPDEIEFYTHRSGRTARAGKEGISIIIGTGRDARRVKDLKRSLKIEIEEISVPSGETLLENQARSWAQRIDTVEIKDGDFDVMYNCAIEELTELSKEDLIKKLVTQKFSKTIRNAMRSDGDFVDKGRSSSREDRDDGRFTRMEVNIGKRDEVTKKEILDFICDIAKVTPKVIGDIYVERLWTAVEIEKEKAEVIAEAFKGVEVDGREVVFKEAQRKKSGGRRGGSSDRRGGYRGGDRKPRGGGDRRGGSGDRRRSGGRNRNY